MVKIYSKIFNSAINFSRRNRKKMNLSIHHQFISVLINDSDINGSPETLYQVTLPKGKRWLGEGLVG